MDTICLKSSDLALERIFNRALASLKENIQCVQQYEYPVLIEGAEYQGIWLESGPLSGLIYSSINSDIAYHNHHIFMNCQRADGYIPCWIRRSAVGTAQIQQVVPLAATALELYRRLMNDAFLEQAYVACVHWDHWLARHRDSQKLGLCELFCEYDTGHDHSPRFRGLPKECPNQDAAMCPRVGTLPYLAPDLSATLYGGRIALAQMAKILNRPDSEVRQWQSLAELTRQSIMAYCFDPETFCFYDRDRDGQFIRICGDALTRVLSEHVVDHALAQQIFAMHILNPKRFWTTYPLPSIAVDEKVLVSDFPHNSWGGAAQALTALRAPRWFEYYGQYAPLCHLMKQWLAAFRQVDGFYQQLNPFTGEFTRCGTGRYSPSMLVCIDFVSRLYGVRAVDSPDVFEWASTPQNDLQTDFYITASGTSLHIQQAYAVATLHINDQMIAKLTGACRLITHGPTPIRIINTASTTQIIRIDLPNGASLSYQIPSCGVIELT